MSNALCLGALRYASSFGAYGICGDEVEVGGLVGDGALVDDRIIARVGRRRKETHLSLLAVLLVADSHRRHLCLQLVRRELALLLDAKGQRESREGRDGRNAP